MLQTSGCLQHGLQMQDADALSSQVASSPPPTAVATATKSAPPPKSVPPPQSAPPPPYSPRSVPSPVPAALAPAATQAQKASKAATRPDTIALATVLPLMLVLLIVAAAAAWYTRKRRWQKRTRHRESLASFAAGKLSENEQYGQPVVSDSRSSFVPTQAADEPHAAADRCSSDHSVALDASDVADPLTTGPDKNDEMNSSALLRQERSAPLPKCALTSPGSEETEVTVTSGAGTSVGQWTARKAPPTAVQRPTVEQKIELLHKQLDAYSPKDLLLQRFTLQGRGARRLGGVIPCNSQF
jgi:hypothetical protein